MYIFWGDDLVGLYNDAYRPSLGEHGRHPQILGQRGAEAWPEIWDDIGPMINEVKETGKAIWRENLLVPILRNGQMEDVYWTFSYGAIIDEEGVNQGVLTVCTETTRMVKANDLLLESEQRFRNLSDQSPVWIWMTDLNINVEYANDSLLQYLGLTTVSEFEGKIWMTLVHPKDVNKVFNVFSKAVESQEPFSLEFRVKNGTTGNYEWFLVKGVPRLEGEKMTGYIGTGMNIHNEKNFSEQLQKEVEIRTEQLKDNNVQLEKMNEELQSFTFISSHDLQEPLRKIQTFCSMLLDSEYDRLSESGKDKFTRIQLAANRMQVLINDLLVYSRLDTDKRTYNSMELKEIVNELLEDHSEELNNRQAEVNVKSSCEIQVVHFQFRQLMSNLMSNSLKYAKEDETPIITIEGKQISANEINGFSDLKYDRYAQISFTDNGIGFDNSFSEKIFDVFQRLHGQEKYTGTGVGLAIVKKIAANHDGFVVATGELGKGAEFKIYIPVRSV